METIVEVADFDALMEHLRKLAAPWPTFPPLTDKTVHIEPYVWDNRIQWNTYLVILDNYGVLGFLDGPMSVTREVVRDVPEAVK